jgi:hypothetical protein
VLIGTGTSAAVIVVSDAEGDVGVGVVGEDPRGALGRPLPFP